MEQVSKVILFLREGKFYERSECSNPPSKKKRYFTNELHTKNFWRP
jgi:hypothetical protein